MNPKTKKIITRVITIIASLAIAAGGLTQVMGLPSVDRDMTKLGAGDYYRIIGAMKLTFIALYLYRGTSRIGFLLLTCVFAGAMAVLLTHGETFLPAAVPLTVLWIATFLRDRSVFLR